LEAGLIADGVAEIVYADDGAGLSESALAQVFDPFFTTKRGEGGSGIGMHLAKKNLEELYGASIAARNGPAGGAMFRIILPLAKS
jgi:signal transduction histidine kinase